MNPKRSVRLAHILLSLMMVFSLVNVFAIHTLAANTSASLSQWANLNTAWVNGNLGASKADYKEGQSVPYRITFTGVSTTGSHTVTFEWDTTKSGKHALDYLTSYDRSVSATPLDGVSGVGSTMTYDIPADPQVVAAGVTPIPGKFTIYGGEITDVSSYSYANGSGFDGDKSARITITFTASVSNPVLAWGGHISTRLDWGTGSSCVRLSTPGSLNSTVPVATRTVRYRRMRWFFRVQSPSSRMLSLIVMLVLLLQLLRRRLKISRWWMTALSSIPKVPKCSATSPLSPLTR
jgi:hypothetical protein